MNILKRLTARHLLPLSLGVLLVSSLAACDTNGDDVDGTPLTDVLAAVSVGNTQAQLVNDTFPSGSGTAPTVTGNDEIVRGGSILLNVQAPQGANRVLVGVDGDYAGYYRANISSSPVTLVVTSDAGIDLNAFTLLVATEANGTVSQAARLPITVNTQAGTSGQLQISLNWNAPVDLDLHVETPNGEDIYYGSPTGQGGGMLDLDSNAGCALDRIDNENISWGDNTPPSGQYIVRVDLWSACDYTSPIPFVVTVNRRGNVTTFSGTFQPEDEDFGGAFSGRTITTFTF